MSLGALASGPVGRRYDTVSFLSDFGSADAFAGQVRSVLRDLASHVSVVDLTHDIAPFDVRGGSLALARCVPYLPEGVVLAVVDPGVGTDRAAVAIEVAGGAGVMVGPDNGLLAPAVALAGGADRAVRITAADLLLAPVGVTSAGRDVFAPAAAHLCNGGDLAELGEAVDPALLVPGLVPLPRAEGGHLVTEVLWVDRYGNVQLNVGPDELRARWPVELGTRVRVEIPALPGAPGEGRQARSALLVRTYTALSTGELGLVEDGYGMLSLCCAQASAALDVGLDVGDQVLLSVEPDEPEGPPRVQVQRVQLRTNG